MTDVDLSEFRAKTPPSARRKPCRVRAALDTLEGERLLKLEAALAKLDIPPTAIASWCNERAMGDVRIESVSSHRRRKCRCYEDD